MQPPRFIAIVCALGLAAAGGAHAQVYRCVDAAGRTTYQQTPCERGSTGRPVDLSVDNGATRDSAALEAEWAAAAKQGQVVAGMPRRHVQTAYGVPTEVRAGSTAERVSEVWIYRNPGGTRRLGFIDGRVAWERGDDASSAPPAADESADTASRRESATTAARRRIAPGRDCGTVLAEAGLPDRTERLDVAVPAPDGRMVLAPAERHVYDSDGGVPPRDVAFTCVNGVVTQVDRGAR